MKYAAPAVHSRESAEALAGGEDAAALGEALIALSLADPDVAWTASFLLRMTTHAAPGVRGAAVLGLGHLSRRFRAIPESRLVADAIDNALSDPDAWVRGQAAAAADDFETFIGRPLVI